MNIYEEYGKLMIQEEILQSNIRRVKSQIAEELNSNGVKPEPVEETVNGDNN